jgi:hypothetical protein
MLTTIPAQVSGNSPKDILKRLNQVCTETLNHSLEGQFGMAIGRSYVFACDLSIWREVLFNLPEQFLFEKAEQEYLTSILNLSQGQYRNAFKCLRLVLELCLQGVYLAANLVELQEWLKNSIDTSFSVLIESEKGPLSSRFCKAFFPEIEDHANNFRSIAKTLYRELSETIHGNVPHNIPLPNSFEFSEPTFNLWHTKAAIIRIIVHFCLCCRYLKTLPEDSRAKLEQPIVEQLGHIEEIRLIFGGPHTYE